MLLEPELYSSLQWTGEDVKCWIREGRDDILEWVEVMGDKTKSLLWRICGRLRGEATDMRRELEMSAAS